MTAILAKRTNASPGPGREGWVRLRYPRIDAVPDGWATASELADRTGLGERQITNKIRDLADLVGVKRKVNLNGTPQWIVSDLHTASWGRVDREEPAPTNPSPEIDRTRVSERDAALIRERSAVLDELHKYIAARRRKCLPTKAQEEFCKLHGVSVSTVKSWQRKLDRGGPLALRETRGRPRGSTMCDPEAWEYFCCFYLTPQQLSAELCWDLTKVEADKRGWKWYANPDSVRLRVREDIPKPTLILTREGRKAFDAKCAPRIRRSKDHIAANDAWCGDEHTIDLYARVPDGRGGWKRIRPRLTAWMDERSRTFVGWWIDQWANSDTILAAFKAGVRMYGPPSAVTCDNGADYKAVGGRPRKWDGFDQHRLADVFSQLDIIIHWAIPYRPQSKSIESHFRAVCARFSKLFDSYCGNKPENRPDGVLQIPIEKLPTLDEVREQFGQWLVAHHERPQTGEGMYGLSPRQAMLQFMGETVRAKPSGQVLDFVCCKFTKPVKVTKDGVRYRGISYGQGEADLYALFGKDVVLAVPPDRADFVWVCDERTRKPIVKAYNQRLDGTRQEDIREGERRKKRAREVAKKYVRVRWDLVHTTVTAAIRAQRERNRAEQQPIEPPDPPAAVRITRPDLERDLKRSSAVESKRARTASQRRSGLTDYSELNARLGLGGLDIQREEPTDRARSDDLSVLASGSLLDGSRTDPGDDEVDGAGVTPNADPFDVIRRASSA
jgi:hypothetical protein